MLKAVLQLLERERIAKAKLSDQPWPGLTAKAMESLELLLRKCLPHRLGPSCQGYLVEE